MLSKPADVLDLLRSNISFKTYSDSRLASLYLDNPDGFPFHVMAKVFDVILDPRFKLEDITFKSLWDIFDYISTSRRQALVRPRVPVEIKLIGPLVAADAYSVSQLAISLVVDRMVEDPFPLGDLANNGDWKDAYKLSVADYHAMSLVHSTWTPIARRALRRRVVVPYQQIDRLLLSPLCGPWISAMVVYWEDGDEGATCNNVDLLGALWERTPQLRSLAFVSYLTWPSWEYEERDPPRFRPSDCFELIPRLVPNLEELWLRHVEFEVQCGHLYEDLQRCRTASLVYQLHRLVSLKFLSAVGWGNIELTELEQHPSLEILEDGRRSIYEFRVPREGFGLFRLSCPPYVLEELRPSKLSKLEYLQLKYFQSSCAGALRNCHSLLHLDLHLNRLDSLPSVGMFPSSLVYLEFRGLDVFRRIFSRRSLVRTVIRDYCDHIRSLPHLGTLVISVGKQSFYKHRHLVNAIRKFTDPEFATVSGVKTDAKLSHPVIELCKARGIRFLVDIEGESIRIC